MNKVFIIAEAGVNHNGSAELAHQLVDIAVDAGADAVKFQTFSAEKLVTETAEKAGYQQTNTGGGSQFDMLKQLELEVEDYQNLIQYCEEKGIEFMSTPFDIDAAEFLIQLGMRRLKIPSGELTNTPLIKQLAEKGLPIILSTGMGDMGEVEAAVKLIRDVWQDEEKIQSDLQVLHCTSNYPAQAEEVNLKAIASMHDQVNVPIGYSDHTLGIHISCAAVAMGATVVEKHFTISKELPGPDHIASLEPSELKQYVDQIRACGEAIGDGVKRPTASELETRKVARRSVTLSKDKQAGEVISAEDLSLLRPGTGIPPGEMSFVVGKSLVVDLPRGTTLQKEMLKDA